MMFIYKSYIWTALGRPDTAFLTWVRTLVWGKATFTSVVQLKLALKQLASWNEVYFLSASLLAEDDESVFYYFFLLLRLKT